MITRQATTRRAKIPDGIPDYKYVMEAKAKANLPRRKKIEILATLRYWNELLVKDVPSDILYSLSDFYPGLPYEVNIVRDNESLGLPIYRICETVFFQDQTPPTADGVPEEDKPRKRVNVETTIAKLIGLGALPDGEQASLEHYMLSVEEILKRYEGYLHEWSFLVAQRLIKMQVSRLKCIKYALTEKLNNHSLSSANTAVFGSDQNQGTPPAGYKSMAYFGRPHLQQQTPRPKAEGRWATTPKVRIARVKPAPAAGASSALTLLTRVSSV
jgi:hypothetical protein